MEQGIRIRTVILLWLILSAVSSLQSQSAGDIDTLSQWRVNQRIDFPPWGSAYYCYKHYISGTITIDSIEYYEVYRSGYSYSNPANPSYFSHKYSGALREHENKWYKLEYNNDDVLLYDFTMNVGDTVDPATYGSLIIVLDIDTIIVGGEPKKRFLFNGGWSTGEYIIEDIGATTGLFEPLIFFESESHLHCYAIDFVPLWINPNHPYCDLSVSISEPNKPKSISIYPNPSHSEVHISGIDDHAIVEVSIYNTTGQRVLHQQGADRRVDVSSLQQGLYVVEVIVDEQRFRQKLIVR